MSDLWDVGLVACRTCGMSDLWGGIELAGIGPYLAFSEMTADCPKELTPQTRSE